MNDGLEEEINKFFPKKWKEEDLKLYLSNIKYQPDIKALNDNLNFPTRDFILRGGKRIRPVLFLKTLKLLGIDYRNYFDIAFLIEVVHNGTLILDDIEDNGILRRGDSTCHVKFGLDTAVNTGMSLHILPLVIIHKKRISDTKKIRLYRAYSEELTNVSFGQATDIYWHKYIPDNITEEKYLEMVRLKTGSLMRMSMRMAAIIGSDDEKLESEFSEFAENIGIAFQIIDDALDLRNNGKKFGKSFGNDISEGKVSLPVVYTLEKINNKERDELLEILKLHTRDRRKINRALKIINSTNSIERAVNFAHELVIDAWEDFEKMNKGSGRQLQDIKELTLFFVDRDY